MKKNIFKILVVFIFVLGFNNFAFASNFDIISDTSGLWYGSPRSVYELNGYACIENSGVDLTSFTVDGNVNFQCITPLPLSNGETYATTSMVGSVLVLANNGGLSLNSFTDGGYIHYDLTTKITYTAPPSPPVVVSTAGIFFPLDEQGETTASDLTASVGTATSTTVGGLTPIVVVVMGVLLAFIAIKTVISLVYETKQNKK